MPTPNEGHPYRTPCSKCLEKDELLLKEDKKIKDWARAYNELADRFDAKVTNDPDRVIAKWFGIFFVVGGIAGLFGWLLYYFTDFGSGKTGGLTAVLVAFIVGAVILWENKMPKLKR